MRNPHRLDPPVRHAQRQRHGLPLQITVVLLAFGALAVFGVWLAAKPCLPGDLGILIGSVVRVAGCYHGAIVK